ncbi:MAG: shikimate dehydrogenase [Chloroflexi bacterium]|nr:shikimate dehydrogenase [Chloroflexota bacterium]
MHLGLIGYPLGHSLSPKIHHAALEACGLQGEYSLFPIAPDDLQGLRNLLTHMRNGEIHGLNVTIPHKQNVIPLLDELTPTAQAIGAVNTISMRDGKLTGDNTDAPGFLTDLGGLTGSRPDRKTAHQTSEVSKALVVGAGGSARAVVYALTHAGWDVTLSARRPEQAQALASEYHLPIYQFPIPDSQPPTFDLLVNTTPLGMSPNVGASPWPEHLAFPKDAAVYDLVYNPRETKLVRDARAAGLPARTGLGMLIEQAALAFEIWTGHRPPREPLSAAIY